MPVWLAFVDGIRVVLVALTHIAGGSLGSAIFTLSVLVRLALLPLSVKVAIRAKESADKLRELEPELKRLRERYRNDPSRAWAATRALHEQHGIQMMPRLAVIQMLVQMPLGLAVYRVVTENASRAGRFLWMSDLARPDALITGIAATAAAVGVLLVPAGTSSNKGVAIVVAAVTMIVVWRLAAGVGLYWVGSSVVGIAQGLIVRRVASRSRER